MEYMLLIYETAMDFDARTNETGETFRGAWRAYYKAMVDAGVYVSGSPRHPSATGTTVRLRNGKRHVQDGPYADTKEQLAGFIILELPSLDAALDWAARCPSAATGAVEVRPVSPEIHELVVGGNA
jgi:hypothetical protein